MGLQLTTSGIAILRLKGCMVGVNSVTGIYTEVKFNLLLGRHPDVQGPPAKLHACRLAVAQGPPAKLHPCRLAEAVSRLPKKNVQLDVQGPGSEYLGGEKW